MPALTGWHFYNIDVSIILKQVQQVLQVHFELELFVEQQFQFFR